MRFCTYVCIQSGDAAIGLYINIYQTLKISNDVTTVYIFQKTDRYTFWLQLPLPPG